MGEGRGTGKEKGMENVWIPLRETFPKRQDDRREWKSRLWYAHLFKMSLLKQSDRARKNEVWEDVVGHRMHHLVVQCGALSLLPRL